MDFYSVLLMIKHKLILASGSPRRQQLLREAGFVFEVRTKATDESYPQSIDPIAVAKYIAQKKMDAFAHIGEGELVITADTVVKLDRTILGKPEDRDEAIGMLTEMSGRTHEVITGVCLKNSEKQLLFDALTKVTFRALAESEIKYYVDEWQPFDKAGAYGIQEWIGMVGIERIEGSYFNVVGLPVHQVYEHLISF